MNKLCKVCGSQTEEIHHAKFNVSYFRCTNCEFISKDDSAMISKEHELKIYNYHNNSLENEGYVKYLKNFIDTAIIPFVQGSRALDFGSGPSPVLSYILKNDYDFTCDIYDLYFSPTKSYTNKVYNLVVCTEVIEHIPYPLEYFGFFKSLLEEDGTLSMMTLLHPNDNELFLNWHYIRDKSHISFFSLKTLEVISQKVGLKIIYSDNNRCITFKKI
ncbi:class I SAM-dependent methyltransferase [Mycoplasmatota bacterium WC30]